MITVVQFLRQKMAISRNLADEEQKLACNILNELSALGIENQGILLRDSEANEKYENGELADYYAIIRGGVLKDIPTVLVEHSFVDDDSDFENYLSSDAKLKALAEADAKGNCKILSADHRRWEESRKSIRKL